MSSSPFEEVIHKLKLDLPPAPKPVGSYHPVVISGKMAFVSGQVSKDSKGNIFSGKIGKELTLAQGQEAARLAALNVVSLIKNHIGFDRFVRVLRVVGYVQTASDFYEIPQVVNGASDLFLQIFQDKGIHARSAVGVASLPMNAAVEIEATLEIM